MISVHLAKGECWRCGGPTYNGEIPHPAVTPKCSRCDDDGVVLRDWLERVKRKAITRAVENWESYQDRVDQGIFLEKATPRFYKEFEDVQKYVLTGMDIDEDEDAEDWS